MEKISLLLKVPVTFQLKATETCTEMSKQNKSLSSHTMKKFSKVLIDASSGKNNRKMEAPIEANVHGSQTQSVLGQNFGYSLRSCNNKSAIGIFWISSGGRGLRIGPLKARLLGSWNHQPNNDTDKRTNWYQPLLLLNSALLKESSEQVRRRRGSKSR